MISSVNRRSGTRQLLPAKAGKPHFLIRGIELLLRAVQFKDQLRALILQLLPGWSQHLYLLEIIFPGLLSQLRFLFKLR